MQFEFSEEQRAARDVARQLLDKEWPAERLRALWDGDDTARGAVWPSLAEVGFLGMAVPAEHGGMGGDLLDLVLVLEEVGRAALAEPFAETAVVAAALLARAGSDEQRATWLPRIAAGEAVVATRLDASPFVLDADRADLLLAEVNGVVHALPAEAFTAAPVSSFDRSRRLSRVTCEVGDDTRLAGDALGWARDLGAVATSAQLNGVSTRLLEMTLEHVQSRHQFGQPIGAFQAVKHKLASMVLLVESSRATTAYAAYALVHGLDDRSRRASVAKAYACEAAALANTEALQCHGGIGFTWEHDLHLWLKRGKALEPSYGDARWHRRLLAAELFDEGTADA